MPQTEQFYSALKLRTVPTAMLRFNDEWHGTTTKPSNFMRTQLYLRYWFDKYKRGTDTRTTTPSGVRALTREGSLGRGFARGSYRRSSR